jgi:hypothetical protein
MSIVAGVGHPWFEEPHKPESQLKKVRSYVLLRSSRKTKSAGQSIMELAIGLIVLVPVMLVIFDMTVIAVAVTTNDSLCREAARAAAAGDPATMQTRANAIIVQANKKAQGMMSNYQLVSLTNTASAAYLASLGQYGGPVKATVTALTQVDVKPFVVQYAYAGKSPLQFRSQQTFPFTYVFPNTSTATP